MSNLDGHYGIEDQSLRGDEAYFHQLAEAMPFMVWLLDRQGVCTYVNRRWLGFSGRKPNQDDGEGWMSLLHPDDFHAWSAAPSQVRSHDSFERQCRLRRHDGEYRWFAHHCQFRTDLPGNFSGYLCTLFDITEQKRIEQQLRVEKQVAELTLRELESVLDSITEGLIISDLHGRILKMNSAVLALYGYDRSEQMLGTLASFHRGLDLRTLDGRAIAAEDCPFARALRGERFSSCEIELAGEQRSWIGSFNGTPVHDEHGRLMLSVITVRNITARTRAELALRLSEHQLRTVLDTLPVGVSLTDREGAVIRSNPSCRALWSRCKAVAPSVPALQMRRMEGLQKAVEGALREGASTLNQEFTAASGDGGNRLIRSSVVPLRDGQEIAGAVIVSEDITEIRRSDEARARLAAIVDSSYDAVIGARLDGVITSWNAGAQRMYGYHAEEVLGKPIAILSPLDVYSHQEQICDKLKWGIRVAPFETVHLNKAGRRLQVSLALSPIVDEQGRAIAVSAISRDITERKRLDDAMRMSEARFRIALQNSPITVFNQDRALRYTWIHNPAQEHAIGRVLGKRDQDLFERPGQAELLMSLKRQVLQSGVGARQKVLITIGGVDRFFDLTIEPLRDADGRVEGITGAAVDITGYTALESRLRQQTEQLAEAARRKDEFLAMLGHELRNPLAPIHNAVCALRLRGREQDAELKWSLDLIARQVKHLQRLVDDLLDVARITHGRIELKKQALDLVVLVMRAAESVESQVQARKQQLHLSLPPEPIRLEGDPVRINQVVTNLLNNATKYTPDGGRIFLSLRRENDEAVLYVTDTGAGIAEDTLPYVFDMFSQADASLDRSHGGLGLGLTLVRGLVEMHGGRVSASSAGVDQGSQFTVRLPILPHGLEQPLPPDEQAVVMPADPGRQVLVVDDHPDVAMSLSMLLETMGQCVRTAHDGETALQAIRARRPNVVFLDIGLPGMSGYEVARRVRAEFPEEPMLLVALTGYGHAQAAREARAAGFDHHLLKPADPEALERLLESTRAGPH